MTPLVLGLLAVAVIGLVVGVWRARSAPGPTVNAAVAADVRLEAVRRNLLFDATVTTHPA